MKHPFEEKVEHTIESHSLMGDDGRVIVALSGGADSVALLSVMTALGYHCIAAHCDYHLRGEESERDRIHAEDMARRHGAVYVEKHFDASTYSAGRGVSLEMGCRELRYEWFAELSRSNGNISVAVGHHNDDNVETVFLNMLRGTGLTGLTGIKPRNGIVVRPLLDVTRREVLDYLADKGLTYVTDSTNLLNDVKRNRLRNVLLPAIRAYFPDANTTLTRSVHNLTSNLNLYQEMVEKCAAAYRGKYGEIDVRGLAAGISNAVTLLYELLRGYGFNGMQCKDIIDAASAAGSRRFFAGDYVGIMHRGILTVRSCKVALTAGVESYTLAVDDASTWPEGFTIERIAASEVVYDRSGNTLYLDMAKLAGRSIVVRRWRIADRVAPFGMSGTRLVSDLFSDAHYSPDDKERAWIVTAGGQIVWVVGLRTSRHMTLTARSTEALKITFDRCDKSESIPPQSGV